MHARRRRRAAREFRIARPPMRLRSARRRRRCRLIHPPHGWPAHEAFPLHEVFAAHEAFPLHTDGSMSQIVSPVPSFGRGSALVGCARTPATGATLAAPTGATVT